LNGGIRDTTLQRFIWQSTSDFLNVADKDIPMTGPKHFRAVGVFVILTIALARFGIAAEDSAAVQKRKTDLEIEKLELEVSKLKNRELPAWVTGVFGAVVGIVATAGSIWVSRRTRFGALDQSVHVKRLDAYPEAVKATAPLAVYFPGYGPCTDAIGPAECHLMGEALSRWYFDGGGLLMSNGARDAYFKLARALTRASAAHEIRAPKFPKDADEISLKKLDKYRKLFPQSKLDDVENWTFGDDVPETSSADGRFKDYIFLQRLSSALRTELSKDLRSRRRASNG
jgi:hypothetical protein